MTSRFKDHILGPDTHANLPGAAGVPEAALYECTTHGKIYKNVAGTWITYGVLIPPGGTTSQVLTKNSGSDGDVGWATSSGGGGATKMPLDPAAPLDGFTGSSLGAGWSYAGSYVAGDFAVSDSWVQCTNPRVGGNYVYCTPPVGWTVMTAKMYALTPTASTAVGLIAVDNTGAGVVGGLAWNGSPDAAVIGTATSGAYTSGAQTLTDIPGSKVLQGQVHWVRMRRSGTSYFLSSSLNGAQWSPETPALTSAVTITRIGFGAWLTAAAPRSFGLDWFHAA